MMFAVEGEGKMARSARQDCRSINQCATEGKKMFVHKPAPFPPGQLAENAAVIIHGGWNIGRDEAEIEGWRHQQRIGKTQPEHTQRGDEKPNSLWPATQLSGA